MASIQSFSQQATLTIKNKSERYLKIRVMKGTEKKAVLFATDSIAPNAAQVVYITETGMYFTKTQAILFNKKNPAKNDTVYSKDRPFLVKSDSKRGYDNIMFEYVIEETKKAQSSMSITRKEYDN
ncbi:MAG TPA: hypothetical protein VN026_02040 [Bacteroidia bacterium]|nr:hypothetical protein [Bacteroidia bacterium]